MEELFLFINTNSSAVIAILLLAVVILLILNIVALRKSSKAEKIFKSFVGDIKADDVEELLRSTSLKLQDYGVELNLIKQEIKKIDGNLAFAIQSVGMVKYDAFENIGNNLSFSLALLDKFKNGIVITSIYGRDFTTLYGKPISYGKTDYQLSEEEEEAINRAIRGEFKEKKINS